MAQLPLIVRVNGLGKVCVAAEAEEEIVRNGCEEQIQGNTTCGQHKPEDEHLVEQIVPVQRKDGGVEVEGEIHDYFCVRLESLFFFCRIGLVLGCVYINSTTGEREKTPQQSVLLHYYFFFF